MDGALKIDSIEGLKTMSSKIEPNNSWSLALTTSVSKESKVLNPYNCADQKKYKAIS
jgi:hypothetical protein